MPFKESGTVIDYIMDVVVNFKISLSSKTKRVLSSPSKNSFFPLAGTLVITL